MNNKIQIEYYAKGIRANIRVAGFHIGTIKLQGKEWNPRKWIVASGHYTGTHSTDPEIVAQSMVNAWLEHLKKANAAYQELLGIDPPSYDCSNLMHKWEHIPDSDQAHRCALCGLVSGK